MAAPTPPGHGRPDEEAAGRTTPLLDSLAPAATLRAFAFWTAVVVPFLHVPLLASGLSAPGELRAFAALLALNVAALYVGHPYASD